MFIRSSGDMGFGITVNTEGTTCSSKAPVNKNTSQVGQQLRDLCTDVDAARVPCFKIHKTVWS